MSLTHRTRVSERFAVTADLRDQRAVLAAMGLALPSLVIHTAYAKDEASIVTATRNVVDAATVVGADVMHISTDVVFSGDGVPRDEDAHPDPVMEYGRWKAVAEEIVGGTSAGSTIVRLPLIVSLDPDDHVTARIRAGASSGNDRQPGSTTRYASRPRRQNSPRRSGASPPWADLTVRACGICQGPNSSAGTRSLSGWSPGSGSIPTASCRSTARLRWTDRATSCSATIARSDPSTGHRSPILS